ncbi:MAG: tRNA (adenosine(37)-N6)-threonylcarbamoyltransferase complex transferase subunit TsaD [Clostridia bacterium]|nr:tRNA (adenosine(37)-N6)-threonylcarbamoyltransferase complex transferase subunit TsaD [Clostridia bacterium]
MLVLAIESSCDETSVSIVDMTETKRIILSNEIASQIPIHQKFGGVVPEIAGRAHIEAIAGLCDAALKNAGVSQKDISLCAVTNRPGLIGALLVGVNFAKSFAYANNIPLVAVNHIRGHIAANYLAYEDLKPPFLALVVSGGHTSLVDVRDFCDMESIGATRDDAAGEAFDKAARVMGLPYPGGAEMDRLAKSGNKDAIKFPKVSLKDSYDFSFSGLKTAFMSYINTCQMKNEPFSKEDLAASFTNAVISEIEDKLTLAVKNIPCDKIVLAGGVSANSHLRAKVSEIGEKYHKKVYIPPLSLCGDNGAMIAAAGYFEYLAKNTADLSLNAYAAHGIY